MMLQGTQLNYMPAKSHVIIIILLSVIHKAKSFPQQAKWKHNKNLINSTNFPTSFQMPFIFCPSMKYRFNFCLSPDWADDLYVSLALFCWQTWIRSLAKCFCFSWVEHRLDGDECLISFQFMHLELMHSLSLFSFQRRTFAEFHCIHRSTIYISHHFSNFFTSHSCSLGVFCLSFLLNFIQLLVV